MYYSKVSRMRAIRQMARRRRFWTCTRARQHRERERQRAEGRGIA